MPCPHVTRETANLARALQGVALHPHRIPTFSPDGQTLAFVRTSSIYEEDIYLVPVASDGEPGRLTFDNTVLNTLTWTADGREIVFSSSREGSSRLWRIPVSGGSLRIKQSPGAMKLYFKVAEKPVPRA